MLLENYWRSEFTLPGVKEQQGGGEPDTLTPETLILLHTLHTSASEKPALLGPLFLLPPFLAESVWLHTPESVYFKAIAR